MDFTEFLKQGDTHAWLYLPVAVVLGALHGLEPGHSKTMMAAFIIAVRGTILQAALLGLSAALSHSLVIWALAAAGLKFGSQWNVETTEPYFLIGTGVIVVAMALWTLWRLNRDKEGHHHPHDESHHLTTADGDLELSVFEDGVPPRFRVQSGSSTLKAVKITTIRPDGVKEDFTLIQKDGFQESLAEIPEPHAFRVEVLAEGPSGTHLHEAQFEEHDHDHEDDDAHARAHAEQIRRRFAGREVTTPQIILFGLTGGLMPCPAALSILLICLQLKKVTLGFSLVAAFSIGLAATLVAVGVGAAWGMCQISQRSAWFSRMAPKAPYLSSLLLLVLGLVFVGRGIRHFV